MLAIITEASWMTQTSEPLLFRQVRQADASWQEYGSGRLLQAQLSSATRITSTVRPSRRRTIATSVPLDQTWNSDAAPPIDGQSRGESAWAS